MLSVLWSIAAWPGTRRPFEIRRIFRGTEDEVARPAPVMGSNRIDRDHSDRKGISWFRTTSAFTAENFTYGFYRLSNVQEWKDFPVKYLGREACTECHDENVHKLNASSHASVECENCHGPAANHPVSVKSLPLDTTREMCLRCHARLELPNSARGELLGIVDARHRRRSECIKCHNPHDPREDMR